MRASAFGTALRVGRLRRGIVEFLTVPLLAAAALCAAAVVVAFLDNQGGDSLVRRAAQEIVPPSGAAAFIGVVATSLMTVTSITFSVLLVAVQQTASSLSAVVFDQYLRRRSNQLHLGYFVGSTAFCFIVAATARSSPAPVYGAIAALVLAVGCLVALLLVIHSTVDQMRPESVVHSIHELALRAHERELELLRGTRQKRRTPPGTEARAVRASASGYVVSVDARALAQVARAAGPDAEVLVTCQMGTYIALGEPVARVAGMAAHDDGSDADVLAAFRFDDTRRVEVDAGYSIDQLENIAWMTGTSASQSPYTASAAIDELRDLAGQWAIADERRQQTASEGPEPLPVVYQDGATSRVLRALATLLVGSSESQQAHTDALIVNSFAHVLPQLTAEHDLQEVTRSLDAALPSITEHAALPALEAALSELVDALDDVGRDARRVKQVQARLRSAGAFLQQGRPDTEQNPTACT